MLFGMDLSTVLVKIADRQTSLYLQYFIHFHGTKHEIACTGQIARAMTDPRNSNFFPLASGKLEDECALFDSLWFGASDELAEQLGQMEEDHIEQDGLSPVRLMISNR